MILNLVLLYSRGFLIAQRLFQSSEYSQIYVCKVLPSEREWKKIKMMTLS